jgi:hypothetical protein
MPIRVEIVADREFAPLVPKKEFKVVLEGWGWDA